MKVVLLFLLSVSALVYGFDQTQKVSQFLDSQPHPLIRLDFDFPSVAVGAGSLVVQAIADFGPYKVPGGSGTYQYRYSGAPDANLRNVKIYLRTPSGDHDIYLGKFFDELLINNGYYLTNSFFYTYDTTSNNFYYYNNYYYDYGYYNTRNVLQFYFDADLWIQITKEGSASIVFEFSQEVNSYYLIYPLPNVYSDYYPGEEFLSAEISFNDAAALGDPHFFGWNGVSFDFQGENHHIYNLISHKDTQINFQMKQRNFFSVTSMEEMTDLSHNTYIGTLGIKTKSHELVLFSGESGFDDAGYIELDGVRYAISREKQIVHSDSELTVTFVKPARDYHLGRDPVAAVCEIECGIYSLRIFFIEAGRSLSNLAEWHAHPFRFFDVYASINEQHELRGKMHGVLGQTGDNFLSKKPSGAEEWSIEGTFEDYRVSDLFSSDFKFNLFAHHKN